MGIYGTWFVATDAELAALWQIRRGTPAINPFTRQHVTIDAVVVDEAAIGRFANVEEKFLIAEYVCPLFGEGVMADYITPRESEAALCRVPDPAVRALVARAPSIAALFREWKENLARLPDKTSHVDAYDPTLAAQLYALAKTAAASGRSLVGYVR